jgi:hypothetical protein
MAMPTKSPLLAPNLACAACGSIMKPKVVKGPKGVVAYIEYECRMSTHDPYRIESTAMECSGMQPMRADGTAVKL